MLRIQLADCRNESPLLESAAQAVDELCRGVSSQSQAAVFCRPAAVDPACQAAAAGQHILVIDSANQIQEIDQLLEACSVASVELMFARVARYRVYPQAIADSLTAKLVGEPGLVRIHHWQPSDSDATASERLIDEIDIAGSLFNSYPQVIFGLTVGDGFQAHLGYPSGGMALLDCVNELPRGAEPYYTITLVGSQGAAYADDHHNTNLLIGKTTTGLPVRGAVNPYTSILQDFVSVINQDIASEPNIQAAKRATKVTAAVIEACQTGNSLKLVGDRYELQ